MNNSLLQFEPEPEVDIKPTLQKREAELVKTIEALKKVVDSEEWKVLKVLIFDSLVSNLERQIQTESGKSEINAANLYRLNGQLTWARRYSDLDKLTNTLRVELVNIRKNL